MPTAVPPWRPDDASAHGHGAWVQISPAAQRIILARTARSIGQGALVAAFTLYLHALQWNAPQIGAVLSGGLLIGAALTLWIGPLSDRTGRRRFLLGYELVMVACAAVAFVTATPWLLVPAALLGSFGRGANGAAGPFGPLEQSWLAHGTPPALRAQIFSLNSTLGMLGMALGAVLGAAPHWLIAAMPVDWAYRSLFLLPLIGSAVGFFLLLQAQDAPTAVKPEALALTQATPGMLDVESDHTRHLRENALLWRLGLVNALNGLGIGMVAPLMAYWYLVRFGHGPASIGPAMATSFVFAAFGAQIASRLAQRFGVVRAVVGMRAVGLVMLVLTPLSPVFWIAVGFYSLRATANQGTMGVRQALTVSLTGSDRRGLAATVNNVSIQIPRAIGPLIAGVLLHLGWLVTPFLVAATFQAAYLVLYQRFFRGIEPGNSP
ncbi:MAG: MFS transporter [Thiomonas sp. 20-64-9]|nr:MAG: MFS transporter [Thiomonas sp. 20-64-9]